MLTFRSWWGPASKDYTSTPCVVVASRQEFIKSWPNYKENMSQDMVYVSFSLSWTGALRLERWLMEKSILPCVVELSLLLCEGGAASRLIISRWDLYSTCWVSLVIVVIGVIIVTIVVTLIIFGILIIFVSLLYLVSHVSLASLLSLASLVPQKYLNK